MKKILSKDIRSLLRGANDDLVSSVVNTGASYAEVLKAISWLDNDNFTRAELKDFMSSRAYKVYEILQSERDSQRDEI